MQDPQISEAVAPASTPKRRPRKDKGIPRKQDGAAELEALDNVISALVPLAEESREKVITTVCRWFGLEE